MTSYDELQKYYEHTGQKNKQPLQKVEIRDLKKRRKGRLAKPQERNYIDGQTQFQNGAVLSPKEELTKAYQYNDHAKGKEAYQYKDYPKGKGKYVL